MSDRPSPLFFLVSLAGSSALASLASLLAHNPGSEMLVGNGAFFMGFAACCAFLRPSEQPYHAEFLTGFLLFVILATASFLCGMAWETGSSLVPDLLRRPVTVLGYVSAAPDSWPPLLAITWMITVLPATLMALLAGRTMAHLRANRTSAELEDKPG
jgi:hypothetical protein